MRDENQDACLADPENSLFMVSDGMGGHQGGALASKAIVSVLPKIIETRFKKLKNPHGRAIHCLLRDSILQLSRQLREESSDQIGLKGMGATLVMALIRNRKAYIAHMGDSRAYLFRQGQLTQLTEDHSVVGILLRSGEITPEEAKTHPARGQLSRYVGMKDEAYPDVQSRTLKKGDRILLCSDGLTGMIDDKTIADLLHRHTDPKVACQSLINAANTAGGHDNITVIILDYPKKKIGTYRLNCVFSASVYDMIFRGCYRIRRQQRYLMRTTYEEPIEIEFTGKACPWT